MDLLAAVQDGRADIGTAFLAFLSGSYPLFSYAELPGIIAADPNDAFKQVWAIATDPRMMEINEKAFRELGVVPIFQTMGDPSNVLYANAEANSIAGMKDVKIRTSGLIQDLAIQALGGTAIQVPYAEIAQALLTGIVDAVASNWEGYVYYGFTGEWVKYAIPMPFGPGWADFTVVNAEVFDSLPPDLQQVFKDVGRDMMFVVYGNGYASTHFNIQKVQDLGMDILYWSPEEEEKAKPIVATVHEEWLNIAGPYGPQVLEIAKDVVGNYNAFNAYPK